MVRLGVRVIHKITPEAKLQQIPINSMQSSATILPKTLRLRLSPKALKLAHKFTTANTNSSCSSTSSSTTTTTAKAITGDEKLEHQQQHQRTDNSSDSGAVSRIDVERGSRISGDDSKVYTFKLKAHI